ncbi:G-type lectin S-receptor-like serine/threonine-protein kinase SD2-2 [Salvia miltiorrhiza]|uniref:G-type lectin S-receptor-like serine/threonine-protein kinase SD2-2 n=1 Tax=Salvia miltiorrhiza TaxID=226208 RepID=UPI0025AC903D|nr:G-type lectin S-receptor-like serine/threonine-protein kinase SD2-2 [Salvia miltiorrhiza]
MSADKMHLPLKFILICFLSSYILASEIESVRNRIVPHANSARTFKKVQNFTDSSEKLESLQKSQVILSWNATISSENRTFKVGFFSPNDEYWYFGIWYASIPIPAYIWVANRDKPIKNLPSAAAEITDDGKLAVVEQDSRNIMWESNNVEEGSDLRLLEQGDLLLLSSDGRIVWRSFDFPTDTWLPGMNLTAERRLTAWRSSVDPAPGRYSLRLNPPYYGEIALVYSNDNDSSVGENNLFTYWTTGNWSGNAFAGVPQMTIPYIYRFEFVDPFTPMATFGYTEVPLESGMKPPLTRFVLDHMGQLKQFTWSPPSEVWNTFWSQPDNICRVYALCGNLGLCNGNPLSPCQCLNGFRPLSSVSWSKDDFADGCLREGDGTCSESDKFEEVGGVSHDRTMVVSFSGSRSECESACLKNCSCVGLYHNSDSNLCKNLYGSLLNLRNVTSDNKIKDNLCVRVETVGAGKKRKTKSKETTLLIGMICGFLVILSVGTVNVYLRRRKIMRRKREDNGGYLVTNLRVFSYKELHGVTRGFSVKLGHGGFGAVFQGVLSDSAAVAVKRLERPGGGEKEFRAEVCTIGNIQHVNLVRLRGFCSENSHRLLVYDYMPNGPLSMYLKHGSQSLSWDVRFRIAVGTARGIAYLHEECRHCIIHCDIKPENILLDENFSAKVSDFGLAKLIGRDFSRVLATMRGTWGYVAPEWISGVAITSKADVYSYGMTLLELVGGRRNVEGPPSAGGGGESEKEKWFFPPWAARQIIEGNVAAVVDQRLGRAYDEAEAARVGLVAVWCIQDDESTRPTMGMVVKMLEGVVEVSIPPPPKLLQALVSGESFQGVVPDSGRRAPQLDGGSFDANSSISIDSKDSKSSQ